jgi:hypothetical protein
MLVLSTLPVLPVLPSFGTGAECQPPALSRR